MSGNGRSEVAGNALTEVDHLQAAHQLVLTQLRNLLLQRIGTLHILDTSHSAPHVHLTRLVHTMASVQALKSRLRSNYRFFLPYRLRWADNDQYGHVNNSVYNFL